MRPADVETSPADRTQAVLEILSELRAGGASVEASFRRLVEIYYRPVYHFFARRGLTPDESLDLTQETFLGIYTGVRSFRQEAGFDTWLWKIATNAYLKRRRRGSTAKRSGLEVPLETRDSSAPSLLDSLRAKSPVPAEEILGRERSRLLRQAIEKLPDQMRRCLMLRVYQDLKYREIGAALQISIDTVKAHLFQARRRLQQELGDYFGGILDGEDP